MIFIFFLMHFFSSKIRKIGVNPYVLLPSFVLEEIFKQSGKNKGPIPVRGTLNGKEFIQTLVKYSGKWRLYLNTPMRKSAGIDVRDLAIVLLGFDPKPRTIPFHPQLAEILSKNKKAKSVFDQLTPSRQKEIIRYISFLNTEKSILRNIEKVILHLSGKSRFAGRN